MLRRKKFTGNKWKKMAEQKANSDHEDQEELQAEMSSEESEDEEQTKRTRRDTLDDVGGPSSWSHVTQPTFSRKMRLWSKTRFHITIQPNGRVIGVQEDNEPNSELELESVTKAIGEVRIRGIGTGLYLAMNHKGRVYGERDKDNPQTVWVENFYGSYTIYLSKHWAHLGWYLAIKKNGKLKNGQRTKLGQKAIQFLPIRNID